MGKQALQVPMSRAGFFRFKAALMAIVLFSLALRVYGLWQQPPLHDEVLCALTADNYVEHGRLGPIMPNHPNLRNLIVYASMKLFGAGAMGLRGPSVLMGTLGVLLLGLLVRRVSGSAGAGLAAAFLLALDPVHLAMSRQAIQEVHTVFFTLMGCLMFVLAYDGQWGLRRSVLMVLAGLAFGLALASKAHALFPLVLCGGAAIWLALRGRRWDEVLLVLAALVMLPLAVYMLTWLPWFNRGYGLGEWIYMQRSLFAMTLWHGGNPMDSMIDTSAWKWFIKPFMGYANFTYAGGRAYVTVAVGNPVVWMLVWPAVLYCAWSLRRGAARALSAGGSHIAFVLGLFLVSYLPLALSPRPIWVLSSLAASPFAYALVGMAAVSLPQSIRRRALSVYFSLVLLAGLMLYPLSIGRAMDYPYLHPIVERLNPHENPLLRGEQGR